LLKEENKQNKAINDRAQVLEAENAKLNEELQDALVSIFSKQAFLIHHFRIV
jgi:cell division protein FtsB